MFQPQEKTGKTEEIKSIEKANFFAYLKCLNIPPEAITGNQTYDLFLLKAQLIEFFEQGNMPQHSEMSRKLNEANKALENLFYTDNYIDLLNIQSSVIEYISERKTGKSEVTEKFTTEIEYTKNFNINVNIFKHNPHAPKLNSLVTKKQNIINRPLANKAWIYSEYQNSNPPIQTSINGLNEQVKNEYLLLFKKFTLEIKQNILKFQSALNNYNYCDKFIEYKGYYYDCQLDFDNGILKKCKESLKNLSEIPTIQKKRAQKRYEIFKWLYYTVFLFFIPFIFKRQVDTAEKTLQKNEGKIVLLREGLATSEKSCQDWKDRKVALLNRDSTEMEEIEDFILRIKQWTAFFLEINQKYSEYTDIELSKASKNREINFFREKLFNVLSELNGELSKVIHDIENSISINNYKPKFFHDLPKIKIDFNQYKKELENIINISQMEQSDTEHCDIETHTTFRP